MFSIQHKQIKVYIEMKKYKDERIVICPQTPFHNIELILFSLYDEGNQNFESLIKNIGKKRGGKFTKSSVNNALPVTNDMRLTYKISKKIDNDNAGLIVITENGKKIVEAIRSENINEIKENAILAIKKSFVLNLTYNIIRENDKISYEKIGNIIERETNRNWKNPITKKNVARTCIHILQGFHVIDNINLSNIRRGGKLSQGKSGLRFNVSGNQIFDYVKKLKVDEFTQVTYPFQSKRKNDKILTELSTLEDLKLVERTQEKFKLTEQGIELRDVLETSDESKTFRKFLFNYYPAKKFIAEISLHESSFNCMFIGKKMSEFNNAEWKNATIRSMGLKFLNCMKKADIAIENGKRGRYRINHSVLSNLDDILSKNIKEDDTNIMINRINNNHKVESDIDSISESLDGERYIIRFKNYLFDVLIDEEWNSKTNIHQKINDEIKHLKLVYGEKYHQIILNHISDRIEEGFNENKIYYIQKAGEYLKEFETLI